MVENIERKDNQMIETLTEPEVDQVAGNIEPGDDSLIENICYSKTGTCNQCFAKVVFTYLIWQR